MWLLSLALRHWKPLALIALVLGLIATGYAWKAHNARQAAELAQAVQAAKDAQAQVAALEDAAAKQAAANEAAQAARERNDTKIPEVRAAAKARVDRASDAGLPVADQLRDDQAALDAYAAAAGELRGTKPN